MSIHILFNSNFRFLKFEFIKYILIFFSFIYSQIFLSIFKLALFRLSSSASNPTNISHLFNFPMILLACPPNPRVQSTTIFCLFQAISMLSTNSFNKTGICQNLGFSTLSKKC
ncbi:TPA: hypothetical protein DEG21_05940 [Patescibacteria group bacterium]|nr:hypothetical protein [Candidatus Gracilibacteria bacterium]